MFLDLQFPVEIHRAESMYSLRNRRDQSHAGNRAIRSKRVIDKAGEEHIDYINIPRRSVRFFKDFVNTLVRIFFMRILSFRLFFNINSLSIFNCRLMNDGAMSY